MRSILFVAPALGLAGTLSLPPAQAQESNRPTVFTFGQSFTWDSNVLRLSDGVAVPAPYTGLSRGDWFSRTYGGVAYANNIGTQSISLGASLDLRRYHGYSALNRNNYDLYGNWRGDLDRAWYASVGVAATAYATEFYNQTALVSNTARVLSTNARLGYRFSPTWSAFGAFDISRRSNSAGQTRAGDMNQRGLEFGARFEPGTGLDAELVARRRNYDFPNAQNTDSLGNLLPAAFDNSFQANQLVFRVNYQPTGVSSLNAQVGYSNARYNVLTQRNNSGLILGLNYRYAYSDALTMTARVARDLVGEQVSYASPVETQRLGFDVNWRVTGRVSLNGSFDTSRRRFNADPGVVLGTSTLDADRIQSSSISASYELLRTVRLNVGFARSSRNANVVNIPYSGTTANIGIDVRLD